MPAQTKLSQEVFVYGLICACMAAIVLPDGILSFAIAYSILVWMGYGMQVVFGRHGGPRPRHFHRMLYAGL